MGMEGEMERFKGRSVREGETQGEGGWVREGETQREVEERERPKGRGRLDHARVCLHVHDLAIAQLQG